MQSFCNTDRNRLIEQGWKKLVENCRHHEGVDPDHPGYKLCSENYNTGTVPQAKGFRRCNILCCAKAGKVHIWVQKTLARNAKQREKENTVKELTMAVEDSVVKQEGKTVDLTDFVSRDSLQYA